MKAKIEKAVATVMASPSVRARLAKLDITPDFAPGAVMRRSSKTRSPTGPSSSTPTASSRNELKQAIGGGVSTGYDLSSTAETVQVETDGTNPLLAVLRDELALRGTRFGCGTEQCGACMVLIDGEPEYSCAREVATVAGAASRPSRGWRRTARCIRCSRHSSTSRPGNAAIACRAS